MKTETNIYKVARLRAEIPQIESATDLALSRRCLAAYESGARQVPEDIVLSMMKLYRAEYLGYLHLRESRVGQIILPKLHTDKSLAACTVMAQIASDQLRITLNELLAIAADDMVSDSEEATFKAIQEHLKLIIAGLFPIAIGSFGHKKRTASVGALTALGL